MKNVKSNSALEEKHFYVIEVDMEGKYRYLNDVASRVFGLDPVDTIGTNSLNSIIPEDHKLTYEATMQCVQRGETVSSVFIRKPTPRGVITNEWEFDLVRDDNGEPSGVRCVGYTVDGMLHLKSSLEKELITIQRKLEKQNGLNNMLAHDLRSPIANIKGLLELHENDSISTEDLLDRVTSTVGGLEAKLGAINEHMKSQTISKGVQQTITLPQILMQVVAIERSDFRAIDADLQTDGKDVLFKADPLYIQSILHNLISNSIKYRRSNVDLVIKVKWELFNDELHFSVKDNGKGIDLDKYGKNLFKAFTTFHDQKDSNGFGLFSINEMIRQMGGEITVDSKLGEFTRFDVTLPVTPIEK